MSNSKSWTTEIRFKIEPDGDELIHAFVFTHSPDFLPAHGWHTKTFGKSMTVASILATEIGPGKHLTEWAQGAP